MTLSGAAVQCRFTRSVPELRWQEQEHWRGTYAHFQRCLVLRLGAIAAVATATFAAAGALWANHPGTDAPLARGTQADLLVVRGNPLADVAALIKPEENLRFVVKGGAVTTIAG